MKTNSLIVIALFMSVLLLGGCSKSSEMERYAKLVEYWQGREIKLPEVMTDILTGDTIDFSDADFTILTYVDSAGCQSCKMKLPLWKEYINTIDSISDATINVLMIVSSNEYDEIRYTLTRDNYNYPVVIDIDNQFNSYNQIPKEVTFQSFLLDKSNKVLAIGNPVFHHGIALFYNSIISGEQSFSKSFDAIVKIENHDINLGLLAPKESKKGYFKIINEGDDSIYIRKIVSSCDCTAANTTSDVILPKSSLDGFVSFSGDTITGEFNNSILIFYNGFDYPSILRIAGKID